MRTLLDTNVVSELGQRNPEPAVLAFVSRLDPGDTYLSTITIGELVQGIEFLPAGKRRDGLGSWFEQLLDQFDGRIVSVNLEIAMYWGALNARVGQSGYSPQAADGLIAATALVNDMQLATRNARHFAPTGVPLVNPWEFDPA